MLDFKKLLAIAALTMTVTGIVSADEITLGADIWPTFNGEPGSESPGYMIEVAQKVFKAKGKYI